MAEQAEAAAVAEGLREGAIKTDAKNDDVGASENDDVRGEAGEAEATALTNSSPVILSPRILPR